MVFEVVVYCIVVVLEMVVYGTGASGSGIIVLVVEVVVYSSGVSGGGIMYPITPSPNLYTINHSNTTITSISCHINTPITSPNLHTINHSHTTITPISCHMNDAPITPSSNLNTIKTLPYHHHINFMPYRLSGVL